MSGLSVSKENLEKLCETNKRLIENIDPQSKLDFAVGDAVYYCNRTLETAKQSQSETLFASLIIIVVIVVFVISMVISNEKNGSKNS